MAVGSWLSSVVAASVTDKENDNTTDSVCDAVEPAEISGVSLIVDGSSSCIVVVAAVGSLLIDTSETVIPLEADSLDNGSDI